MKPVHQPDQKPATQTKQPSPKMRLLASLERWSTYGFWFGVGLCAANLSRLIGFPLLYLIGSIATSAYLLLHQPGTASPDVLSRQRLCGLAVLLSCVAFWDAAYALAWAPITIGRAVFPAWQVAVAALLFAAGIFFYAKGGRK